MTITRVASGVVVLTALIFASGCVVLKSKYDHDLGDVQRSYERTKSDLATALSEKKQAEETTLKTEERLKTALAKSGELQKQLDAAKTAADTAARQSQIAIAQAELKGIQKAEEKAVVAKAAQERDINRLKAQVADLTDKLEKAQRAAAAAAAAAATPPPAAPVAAPTTTIAPAAPK